MNTLLIVCDKIQEINRLRRNFDDNFIIKATGAMQSAAYVASTSSPNAIIYQLGDDYTGFFLFYKQIRLDKATKDIPLLIVADVSVMQPLANQVKLIGATFVSSSISKEAMTAAVDKIIKQKVMGLRN